MKSSGRRVVLGMSGGVDSSVAAALLLEQGYQVTSLFMKNWEEDDTDQYCSAAADLADAQAVCDLLGIELRTINFATEYWDRVFQQFLADLHAGRTPNPDVLCNREIKFREFLDYAQTLGADCIATGHYAGVAHDAGTWRLLRAADTNKDQTYFLYTLGQRALSQTLFPLAGLTKAEVRGLAGRMGLPVCDKKDSTGICFIGERRFKDFLTRYLQPRPGDVEDLDGCVHGRHDGVMYYTLGQRRGLGIGGPGDAWYAAGKDVARNVLYVVQGHDHPALYSRWLHAADTHWVAGRPPRLPVNCRAKTRYRQPSQACTVERSASGLLVRFSEPQRALTPGQAVVFYSGETCLGGATIIDCEALRRISDRGTHAA